MDKFNAICERFIPEGTHDGSNWKNDLVTGLRNIRGVMDSIRKTQGLIDNNIDNDTVDTKLLASANQHLSNAYRDLKNVTEKMYGDMERITPIRNAGTFTQKMETYP